MRIAIISTCAAAVPPRAYGGIELFVAVLARELVRLGNTLTVYATGDSHPAGRLRFRFAAPIWPPDYAREREHAAFAWRISRARVPTSSTSTFRTVSSIHRRMCRWLPRSIIPTKPGSHRFMHGTRMRS